MEKDNCYVVSDGDYKSLSKSFFKQFDPTDEYADCDLFTRMKNDFAVMCAEINSTENACVESDSCDTVVDDFFEKYKSIDKYLKCHLADSMKSEMKELCNNFNDYYSVLQLITAI